MGFYALISVIEQAPYAHNSKIIKPKIKTCLELCMRMLHIQNLTGIYLGHKLHRVKRFSVEDQHHQFVLQVIPSINEGYQSLLLDNPIIVFACDWNGMYLTSSACIFSTGLKDFVCDRFFHNFP